MNKLWNSLKRIWQSLRRITSSTVKKITGGANSTIKVIGAAIGVVAAFIVMLCILILIAIVAVPYGLFGKENKTNISDNAQVQFCEMCGVADVSLIEIKKDKWACNACFIELNQEAEKDNVAEIKDTTSNPISEA